MIPSQGLVIHDLTNHHGHHAHPLGIGKIISHYHQFYNFINISNIEREYRKLLVNHVVVEYNNGIINESLSSLSNILLINCLRIEDHLNKLKVHNRTKRGLVNAVGSIIKFITGNPDATDAKMYEENIKLLFKNQDSIIKQVNKFVSFANHISDRYRQNIDIITQNIEKTNKEFSKLNNIIDLNIRLQYLIHVSNILLTILDDINDIITLSRNGIVSTRIANSSEIERIIDHLKLIYKPDELLPFSKFHLFQILSNSKIKIAVTEDTIICILLVPILNPNTYRLTHIYPIPNIESKVLLPPARYFLFDGIHHFWTNNECIAYENLYICESLIENHCNAVLPVNCTFATAKNNYKLYEQLEDSTILVDFKENTTIIEQCSDIRYFVVQFSNIVFSTNNCKIVIDNVIYSTNTVNSSLTLPFVTNFTHTVTKEVNILNKHLLDIDQLEKDSLLIDHKVPYTHNVFNFTTCILLVTIISILVYVLYKKNFRKVIIRTRRKQSTEKEEGEREEMTTIRNNDILQI